MDMDVDVPANSYQHEILYNRMLPYADKLEEEAAEYLKRIKANISRSLLLSDARGLYCKWLHPGCPANRPPPPL